MRMRWMQGCAWIGVVLLGGCASPPGNGEPAFLRSPEYRQYQSADQCFQRCASSFEQCQVTPHDLPTCTRQATSGQHDKCEQISDPARRNNCLAQALDCSVRGPVDTCSERRAQCLQGCGN